MTAKKEIEQPNEFPEKKREKQKTKGSMPAYINPPLPPPRKPSIIK
jgi:hypothetical protein